MRIGLVGHGVVGSGIDEIITTAASPATKSLEIVKILTRSARTTADNRFTTNVEEFFASDFDVLIECAGGITGPREYVLRALENGIPVVTSNKKLFAQHYQELMTAARANDTRILFDATTAGGIPWLRNIALALRTDTISAFSGIFNGTTNYILDAMTSHNQDFATALKAAQELGFAEADPGDDISGRDVRYKCAITANLCWNTALPVDQIPLFGIENVTPADITYARENGSLLKLIGQAQLLPSGKISAAVMPTFVPAQGVFAAVNANYNCGVLDSSFLGRSAFAGQGAGALPTAFAVVQDVLDLATRGSRYCDLTAVEAALNPAPEPRELDNGARQSRFYLRAPGLDAQQLRAVGIAAAASPAGSDTAFITAPMPLADLVHATTQLAIPDLFSARIETA